MQYRALLVEKRDDVAVITLNRPEKLNAINAEMRSEFLKLLDELEADAEVRVLVVTGAGRAFCAGADIGEFGSGADQSELTVSAVKAVKRLYEFKKPVVGAINGVAAGDGAQWVLAFDLNVASEQARLAWPATRLGIV